MSYGKSIFLSDAPVTSIAENRLWAPESRVIREISSVVDAILTEDGCLTFAVYGAWGTGKTSFLKMVQSRVMERMQGQDVSFCWYEASTYHSVDHPETTIALRIWNTLGGENPGKRFASEAYGHLSDYLRGILEGESSHVDHERVKPYYLLQLAARRTGQLADFPRLLEEVLLSGVPNDLPKKLVLIVDDLDRCRSDFIADVIDVLQRLGSVRNLFVIISIDRELLLSAIRERYRDAISISDEHLALEKYVQYAIDLPEPTVDELEKYVRECLLLYNEEIGKPMNDAILGNERYFIYGVRTKTPRSIKRSINAIRSIIRSNLDQIQDQEKQKELSDDQLSPHDRVRLLIKQQLLEYNWNDFFNRYFKGVYQDHNARELFRELEDLCVALYSEERELTLEEQINRRAIFDFRLDRIKKRDFSEADKLYIPDQLARLIAMPPYWFYRGKVAKNRSNDESDVVGRLAEITTREDLDEQFLKFYLQSEQADAIGDGKASIEAAALAYDLVRRNKSRFSKDVSPRLGNLGVNAEKYKALELAEAIFRIALEIDENPSVLQQFASYILDNRPDLYQEAELILSRLQTGRWASHRLARTLQLLIQLRVQTGQEVNEDLIERLTQLAEEDETNAQQLGGILDAIIRAGRYEQSLKLFHNFIKRFPSIHSRYTLQRMVADALARQPDIRGELIAMDLYRQILANPQSISPGDEPHVMHNYATLLYKHDFDDEAGCLWYKAYRDHPSARMDGSIRRAYSMYLLRTARKDLAKRVIEGEPINEMVLLPGSKALPERFSNFDLPDALSESGGSPVFSCLNGENPPEG